MRVGNVKEIVFSKDPKQMNWLREDFPYAEVKCPPEFSAEVQNEKDGDVLTTKIVVSYNGAHPYFTNAGSIGVSFPLQDRYTDSVTCRDYRCHAHVFCGENTSYIMALRMGGAAPHLGMVLTKGSLSAYSIERDLKLQSNDRGCFWLHPSAQEFAPGDTMTLEWKVFPHQGREDFREKLRAFSQVILVDAEQYVIYPGETSKVTIEPVFQAEKVTVNGASLEKTENGVYEYLFENEKTGEYVLSICADEVKTICRLLVQERPETLAAKRCAFIVDHQQYHGKIKELQGAGTVEVLVDNEIAVQNLTKMANQKGYGVKSEKISDGQYKVTMEIGEEAAAGNTALSANDAAETEKEENCNNTNPEPDYNIEMSEKQEEKHV